MLWGETMTYEVKIVADSIGPNGVRLTSILTTFPRFILAQMNTHRMFSRNSASSRAIPTRKVLRRMANAEPVTLRWLANQRGMEGGAPLGGVSLARCKDEMGECRAGAMESAELLSQHGAHKQHANRILEPFTWHTVLITATEWANFFALRCHHASQPEMQHIACMMRDAMAASTPDVLDAGVWHLPFITEADHETIPAANLLAVSVGRCARLSYLTHDGVRDWRKDVELAERLRVAGHMSPWEHAARAMRTAEDLDELGWGWTFTGHAVYLAVRGQRINTGDMWSGNLRGWEQARKTLAGEAVFGGGS